MKPDYPIVDISKIELKPLSQRINDLDIKVIKKAVPVMITHDHLKASADKIKKASENGAAVILMMGAHVIRSGVQRYIIDLMEKGYISCLSMNGAGMIHDYELALIGATTESVADYIKDGSFGMWKETGRINDIVKDAAGRDLGMGEAVGEAILNGDFPYREISLMANAARLGILTTVHVHIGCDIIHQHPNFCGASYGKTTYTDFLRFAAQVRNLSNGVVMNFGSAVMAPEVFLKALSMARNLERQRHKTIGDFTSLVCDIKRLPTDLDATVSKTDPIYFFRPFKTMLVRTVSSAGESYYVRGFHADTIPQLWSAINTV